MGCCFSARFELTLFIRRKPPPANLSRAKQAELARIPLLAGTLTVSIVESDTDATARLSPRAKILAELQRKAKLGGQRPSEEVEGLSFKVTWDPEYRALGIDVQREDLFVAPEVLTVVNIVDSSSSRMLIDRQNPDDLDIQAILTNVIKQHTKALLLRQQSMLRAEVEVFRAPGVVEVLDDGKSLGHSKNQAHILLKTSRHLYAYDSAQTRSSPLPLTLALVYLLFAIPGIWPLLEEVPVLQLSPRDSTNILTCLGTR